MIGTFQWEVLSILLKAGRELTTADLLASLEDTGKHSSLGAVYTSLDRMIGHKYVERRKGEPLPNRGGKARYYYKITMRGRNALIAASPEEPDQLIPAILGGTRC